MPSMPEQLLERPLAIIGREDLSLGFRALGFKAYSIKGLEDLKNILPEMAKNKVAVCLVEENIYRLGQEELANYRKLPLPIFIPFSQDTKTELLDSLIKEIKLRATGVIL